MATDVAHAYRHLYRSLLRAVQYASPARVVARDQLRAAFRERGAVLDAEGVKRTLWFLEAAARERGLEHRLLKNMIEVRRARGAGKPWRRVLGESKQRKDSLEEQRARAWEHYDMTVAMLNKSMGLLLR